QHEFSSLRLASHHPFPLPPSLHQLKRRHLLRLDHQRISLPCGLIQLTPNTLKRRTLTHTLTPAPATGILPQHTTPLPFRRRPHYLLQLPRISAVISIPTSTVSSAAIRAIRLVVGGDVAVLEREGGAGGRRGGDELRAGGGAAGGGGGGH
ncbi:hypothetical protein EX30DRAFT_386401, partial [Ascodesmis nigricans]